MTLPPKVSTPCQDFFAVRLLSLVPGLQLSWDFQLPLHGCPSWLPPSPLSKWHRLPPLLIPESWEYLCLLPVAFFPHPLHLQVLLILCPNNSQPCAWPSTLQIFPSKVLSRMGCCRCRASYNPRRSCCKEALE